MPFFFICCENHFQFKLYLSFLFTTESLAKLCCTFLIVCRGNHCQIELYRYHSSLFAAGFLVKSGSTFLFICRSLPQESLSNRTVRYGSFLLYSLQNFLSNLTVHFCFIFAAEIIIKSYRTFFPFFCLGNYCQIVLYFSALYLSQESLSVNRYYKCIVSL